MPRINPSVICHKLSIKKDAKPVKQKPRRMNEEKSRAISDEVDCLLQAGFILETFYPDWLSNSILVKKRMGSGEPVSTLLTSVKLSRRTIISFQGSMNWWRKQRATSSLASWTPI